MVHSGSFKKGNKVAKKGDRVCRAYPFCNEVLTDKDRKNKFYCSDKCKVYAWRLRKRLNLK